MFTVALSALAEMVLLNDVLLEPSNTESQSLIIAQIKASHRY